MRNSWMESQSSIDSIHRNMVPEPTRTHDTQHRQRLTQIVARGGDTPLVRDGDYSLEDIVAGGGGDGTLHSSPLKALRNGEGNKDVKSPPFSFASTRTCASGFRFTLEELLPALGASA
ncbi:hypothetical protein B0H13DRAFT_1889077 [Mycena leptocephala]|nr:hypothetical protein B0H13DRAFT_1889077 [Mycena leptocephala]